MEPENDGFQVRNLPFWGAGFQGVYQEVSRSPVFLGEAPLRRNGDISLPWSITRKQINVDGREMQATATRIPSKNTDLLSWLWHGVIYCNISLLWSFVINLSLQILAARISRFKSCIKNHHLRQNTEIPQTAFGVWIPWSKPERKRYFPIPKSAPQNLQEIAALLKGYLNHHNHP